MKRVFAILTLILISVQFAGCAALKRGTAKPAEASADEAQGPAVVLPNVALTSELLYSLLVGEIAGQRGQFQISIAHYVAATKATQDPRVAERATSVAIYGRDTAQALEAAKIWVEAEPESRKAHQIVAVLYIRNGQPEAALPHLEKLLADGDGERFLLISHLLGREQDKQAALRVMEKLVAGREELPEALFAYAHLAFNAGELALAEEIIDRVIKVRSHWSDALVLRARVLRQAGRIGQALQGLQQVLEEIPDDQEVRLVYARLLVDAERIGEARAQFKMLVERAPDKYDVLYALALLSLQSNSLDEAEQYFLKLKEVDHRLNASNYYLAQIAESRKQGELALERYGAVEPGSHYWDAQLRIAALLVDQRGLDAARDHLHGLEAKSARQQVRLYLVEGEILIAAKHNQQAMAVYDKALQEIPDDPDLLYARALLAERLDRLDIMEDDLRRILRRAPDNVEALNALGYTLADRTTRYEEALGYIQRALELQPDSFFILDSMGWVQYRMGNHQEAVKYLQRAIAIQWDSEIAAHLGEVLWVIGDQKGAREIWNSALEKAPGDKILLDVIKRFDQ